MFFYKFLWLADHVLQFVVIPRQITTTCIQFSKVPIIRAAVNLAEDRNTAYGEFQRADQDIWPPETPDAPGDHWSLWVQGSPNLNMPTGKRSRDDEEHDAIPVRGDLLGAIAARRRHR
jgi:hypothetical protein